MVEKSLGMQEASESGGNSKLGSIATAGHLRNSDRPSLHHSSNAIPSTKLPERKSVFREIGLEDDEIASITNLLIARLPEPTSQPTRDPNDVLTQQGKQKSWLWKIAKPQRPTIRSTTSAPPGTLAKLPRFILIVFLIAIVLPGISFRSGTSVPFDGANAGIINKPELVENGSLLERRQNSPTSVCARWSHQSAVVNGTVYIYGGQAKMSNDQQNNTWNDNFVTLDLRKTWQISSPVLGGMPQPSSPPAVANGYLWNSYNSLFLYGGEFADNPPASPLPVSTWEYNIATWSWVEHKSPTTTAGNHSDPEGVPVQRSAEGAGLSVPELGLSWYFGGHQDLYTTEGWSNQIARIYLKSLLEFTHPGFMNTGVQGLGYGEKGASSDGAYRNITQGGLQADAGFTERADGVLVYIPGWGTSGILLGLAGGTADKFTEMNVIDVFDIANSTWYKQATSGTSPPIRVNPCAVVFAAPDASSFNVYLYGGQNLQPYKQQTQYSDLWILTVPSFTWVQVDQTGQSQPPPRAGHTCHAWDGQMVVIGGYVGSELSCDNPVYVFNATSLEWQNTFTALSGYDSQNTQSTQDGGTGLSGSYAYRVPGAVQSIIGGGQYGSATVTAPAMGPATDGPIATGHPPTFTVTQSGVTMVLTAESTATATSIFMPPQPSTSSPPSGPNVGAITAGVIAGILAVLATYLAFCIWLYRRQLALYKNHVAIAQRTSLGFSSSPDNILRSGVGRLSEKPATTTPVLLGAFGTELSVGQSHDRNSIGDSSGPSVQSHVLGAGVVSGGVQDRGSTAPGISTGGPYSHTKIPSEGTVDYGVPDVGAVPIHGWGRGSATTNSSTEDLLAGQEPNFFSVVMSPRRTLRVINGD